MKLSLDMYINCTLMYINVHIKTCQNGGFLHISVKNGHIWLKMAIFDCNMSKPNISGHHGEYHK